MFTAYIFILFNTIEGGSSEATPGGKAKKSGGGNAIKVC